MSTSILLLKPNIKCNPLTNHYQRLEKPCITILPWLIVRKSAGPTLKCFVTKRKPILQLPPKRESRRNATTVATHDILKKSSIIKKIGGVILVFFMALVFVSYSPKNSDLAATCGINSSSLTSSRPSVTKYGRGDDESVCHDPVIWWTLFIFRTFCGLTLCSTGMAIYIMLSPPDENTFHGVPSVIMLQVGLFGPPGSFREHLNRTAQTAHKCKKDGLAYILTETPLAILRHPNFCISGYSSVEEKRNMEDCEKQFRRISMEERGKFVEEARVNLNNINERCSSSQKSTGLNNEYIVITIVVVAKGEYILPTITSREDLKEALEVLGSIPMNKLMAVEVLWSPREENATLTKQKMLKDYPLLRRFSC